MRVTNVDDLSITEFVEKQFILHTKAYFIYKKIFSLFLFLRIYH